MSNPFAYLPAIIILAALFYVGLKDESSPRELPASTCEALPFLCVK